MQKTITTATRTLKRPGAKLSARAKRSGGGAPVVVLIFILGLLIPVQIYAGPIRLSAYRIILLAMIIPALTSWLSGRAGKIRAPDILILFFAIWAALALTVVHGVGEAIEPSGIFFIETVGSYLIARCYIRSADHLVAAVRCLFFAIVFLIPFALYETLTGRPILLDQLANFVSVFPNVQTEARWGLDRVQAVFEHPILYGVFCGSGFSLAVYVLGHNGSRIAQILRVGLITLATFLSLSSGALVTIIIQFGLMTWDRLTRSVRNRWTILGMLFAAAYLVVDVLSNRTPILVFIQYLTFSHHNSYNRVLIWKYGTAEVWRHPLFGIGFNEWERAWFMSTSMDMFWLVHAVQFGLPAFIFFAAAVLIIFFSLGRLKTDDPKLNSFVTGLLLTMIGLSVAGWTVHFWNAVYCLFMFLLGSGMWLLDQEENVGFSRGRRNMNNLKSRQNRVRNKNGIS